VTQIAFQQRPATGHPGELCEYQFHGTFKPIVHNDKFSLSDTIQLTLFDPPGSYIVFQETGPRHRTRRRAP